MSPRMQRRGSAALELGREIQSPSEMLAKPDHAGDANASADEVIELHDAGLEALMQQLARKLGVRILRHTFTVFVDCRQSPSIGNDQNAADDQRRSQ